MAPYTKGQEIGSLIDAIINTKKELKIVSKASDIKRLKKEINKYEVQIKQEMLELGF